MTFDTAVPAKDATPTAAGPPATATSKDDADGYRQPRHEAKQALVDSHPRRRIYAVIA